jgi:RimJ/RimL family protein N-acetyltransferase
LCIPSNTGEWKNLSEAIEWINAVTSKPNSFIFAVFLKNTSPDPAAQHLASADQDQESELEQEDKMIGVMGLSRWNTLHFLFERSTWGQGYCTEALKAYIVALHRQEPSRPWLTAAIFPRNSRSRRVLEKCGFKRWYRETNSVVAQSDLPRKENHQKEDGNEADNGPHRISNTDQKESRAMTKGLDVETESTKKSEKNTLIIFRYNYD